MSPDHADSERLAEAINSLLPALEQFNRFEGTDQRGKHYLDWKKTLDGPLPQKGEGLDAVLKDLREVFIPNGLRNGMPGFSGWVTTSPTTSGVAANLAGSVAGSQRWWVQPFNYVEKLALKWLAELLGLPEHWQGTFSSGGSIANLIGLGAARQFAFELIGIDPARQGVNADGKWRLYASNQVHHVVVRAAALLGLGREAVASIGVDKNYRIDLKELEAALKSDKQKRDTSPCACRDGWNCQYWIH